MPLSIFFKIFFVSLSTNPFLDSSVVNCNMLDWILIGEAKIVIWIIPIMLISGFLSALPYNYWKLNFNSMTPIFTSQYSIKIKAGDFNTITNYSARGEASGSTGSAYYDTSGLGNLANHLTGSEFSPYFTQIHLYRNQTEEPVMIANLPRAIQMRSDIDIIVTFRLDH